MKNARTWPKLVMLFSPVKRQLAWIWISDAGYEASQTDALRTHMRDSPMM